MQPARYLFPLYGVKVVDAHYFLQDPTDRNRDDTDSVPEESGEYPAVCLVNGIDLQRKWALCNSSHSQNVKDGEPNSNLRMPALIFIR